MKNDDTDKPHNQGRMVFGAIALLAFVWFGLFFVLPAISGKPGIAQKMQADLSKQSEKTAPLKGSADK